MPEWDAGESIEEVGNSDLNDIVDNELQKYEQLEGMCLSFFDNMMCTKILMCFIAMKTDV